MSGRGREPNTARDSAGARDLYALEVHRDAEYHEVPFWLDAAHTAPGQVVHALTHVVVPLRKRTSRGDRDLDAAKIDRIG